MVLVHLMISCLASLIDFGGHSLILPSFVCCLLFGKCVSLTPSEKKLYMYIQSLF